MLRLALIGNFRRISSARMAIDIVDSNLADYWVDKIIDTTEKAPKNLILVIAVYNMDVGDVLHLDVDRHKLIFKTDSLPIGFGNCT